MPDPEVAPAVADCCAIIGAFNSPELPLQLLAPRLADADAGLPAKAAVLDVLAALVR